MLSEHRKYLSPDFELTIRARSGKRIRTGLLRSGSRRVEIRNFIPRFCAESSYADSFGYQWRKFKSSQMNTAGKALSFARFYTRTRWKPGELRGKDVLEVGCGAGRFTEVLLEAGANVVSFDLSNAVDVCYEHNRHPRLFLFQGDLFDLPLKEGSFDFVFCYGVLQHTPDALGAFRVLVRYLKMGGRISADNYVFRFLSPFCTPKYVWRAVTKRVRPEILSKVIEAYVPLYLPVDTWIKRIPVVGKAISALIPIPGWNYHDLDLSEEVRLEWAVLDTFDALSARHDHPKRKKEFELACREVGLSEFTVLLEGGGLVVNAVR